METMSMMARFSRKNHFLVCVGGFGEMGTRGKGVLGWMPWPGRGVDWGGGGWYFFSLYLWSEA